jgi:hypothetical protein
MAAKYFVGVNAQTNDHHAVHKEGCPFLPEERKRIYLGEFRCGSEAIREGRRYFSRTKGCLFCSKEKNRNEKNYVLHKLKDSSTIPAKCWQESMVCCLN